MHREEPRRFFPYKKVIHTKRGREGKGESPKFSNYSSKITMLNFIRASPSAIYQSTTPSIRCHRENTQFHPLTIGKELTTRTTGLFIQSDWIEILIHDLYFSRALSRRARGQTKSATSKIKLTGADSRMRDVCTVCLSVIKPYAIILCTTTCNWRLIKTKIHPAVFCIGATDSIIADSDLA